MIADRQPAVKPSLRERRRRARIRWTLVGGAALAVSGALAGLLAVRDGSDWGRQTQLILAPCTLHTSIQARCGVFEVPEDRAHPDGRRIGLRVVVIPTPHQPAAGALFYLEGGPGGAATASVADVNDLFGKINATRDLVLVDQRGTGGSHRLICPQEHVRVHGAPARLAAYVSRCLRHLDGDPRFYTTSIAADDLDDVRAALDYDRVDVFGGSYGATLAQVWLQRHPQSVRTMILDGASLLGVHLYELSARNAERALRRQLARCARQPSCRRAFPHPRADIAALIAHPPGVTHPPGFPAVVLDGDAVEHTIEALLQVPGHAVRIPALVRHALDGDAGPLAVEFVTHVGTELDERARLAMFWEILCSEPWARYDPAATARLSAGSFLGDAAVKHAAAFGLVCAGVPRGVVPAGADAPPRSDVPVLFLAGGADPLDPPANLAGRAAALPNSRVVSIPGIGHGVVQHGCLSLVAARFVAAGTADGLDLTCVSSVRPPPFALRP